METFRLAMLENKTAKFVAHPSYLGGDWGLQDTEIPERMKESTKRREGRVRELLVQTILILRGQRFPSVLQTVGFRNSTSR